MNFLFSISVFHAHEAQAYPYSRKKWQQAGREKKIIRHSRMPSFHISLSAVCLLLLWLSTAICLEKKKSGKNNGTFANIVFYFDKL